MPLLSPPLNVPTFAATCLYVHSMIVKIKFCLYLNKGGKQWQTTPKNLPRMQCARAIPVI